MDLKIIQEISDRLYHAKKDCIPIEPISSEYPEISFNDAYKIQFLNLEREISLGYKVIGKKIGLTSKAMQSMFGVYEPDYGVILNNMVFNDGDNLKIDQFIQPKVEAEIAFVFKDELVGPGITPVKVLQTTDFIFPILELIDSRIKDWKIKIFDTIADNASAAGVVIGGIKRKIDFLDPKYLPLIFKKNGQIYDSGVGANVMGNPVYSITWLANKLAEYGSSIKAGEIVLSGAITKAISVNRNDWITGDFGDFGEISIGFY